LATCLELAVLFPTYEHSHHSHCIDCGHGGRGFARGGGIGFGFGC